MAITSVGYDGTVDEVQWATMVSKVGSYEYGIDGAGDLAVTQSAGTRMISIAAGRAWGRGVMDTSDAATVIQLESVASGSRYDLVALRRTWGPANGGPTEIVIIKGSSAKAIPSGRQNNPGVIDDQPLALVRVQAGSASIPEVIDLRVWGRNGGQLYAKDDLVRSYLSAVGTEVNVAGMLWQRIVGSNNTAEWAKVGPRGDSGLKSTSAGAASGWAIDYIRYRVRDGICEILVSFKRTGANIAVPDNGDVANTLVASNIPLVARPATWWHPLTSGATGRMANGHIDNLGRIYLDSVSDKNIGKDEVFSLAGMYFTDL